MLCVFVCLCVRVLSSSGVIFWPAGKILQSGARRRYESWFMMVFLIKCDVWPG